MSSNRSLRAYLYASVAAGAMSVAATSAFAQACTGPGAPTNTQTKCLTAMAVPGAALRSFDISWVNAIRREYFFADRSNASVDQFDTQALTFQRFLTGFVGIKLNSKSAVDNNHSGPDGVTSHGRWLYAGDGDSTLKVFDLNDHSSPLKFVASVATGGTTRLDEMALTTDGNLLIAANNAEDPPFATLFQANGDAPTNSVTPASIISKLTLNTTPGPNQVITPGSGQSIEQPTWDPTTKRFYVSVPFVSNNPVGCDPTTNGVGGTNQCDGGLLVIDPTTVVVHGTTTYGFYDSTTNTGVIKLHNCGPNGITVGPHDNLLLGCTPGNNTNNTTTQVINATTHNFVDVHGVTGSDEVWFNKGDNRYYLGASKNPGQAVLGVVDGTSVLIENIPQGSNSHSVAADSKRNLIFVPQVAPNTVVGSGGDTTAVGAGICGGTNGCVAVYEHDVNKDEDDHQQADNH